MAVKKIYPIVIISLSITLTACASGHSALNSHHGSFGKANRANIAAHAVAPDPEKKADTYIPADRARVRAAQKAYREGKVKEPEPIRSQSD